MSIAQLYIVNWIEREKNEKELDDAAADFDEANAAEEEDQPARYEVRATRAGTRTAQRLSSLVMANSAAKAKSEEMTCTNIEDEAPGIL